MSPRIVTFTVNPALDVAMEAGEARPGHKIRTRGATYDPGGGVLGRARMIPHSIVLGGFGVTSLVRRLIPHLVDSASGDAAEDWRRCRGDFDRRHGDEFLRFDQPNPTHSRRGVSSISAPVGHERTKSGR
jgi:6-phosphofructokinase 2